MVMSSNQGFSLIEVLVSVFILTVGVIAASSLHLTALHTSQQSSLQTKAVHLAVELAESMRADLFSLTEQVVMSAHDHDCASSTEACHAYTFSSDEIGVWRQRVAEELPGGQAQICQDAEPWDSSREKLRWACASPPASTKGALVIKIGWRDKSEGNDASTDAPKLALVVQPMTR